MLVEFFYSLASVGEQKNSGKRKKISNIKQQGSYKNPNKMKNKSQAATEMLIILAVGLAILLVILSVNDTMFTGTRGKIQAEKARNSVDSIADAAELVYQQGIGSRTRIFVTLPDEIQSFTAANQTLAMQLYAGGNIKDVYRSLDFNVSTTSFPTQEGTYWICVKSLQNAVSIYDCTNESAAAFCGNFMIESGEDCDGFNLGGQTCAGLGYIMGTLACQADCTFDTSSCITGAAPVILWVNDAPDPVTQGQVTTITANITDDEEVDSVWVDINSINYSMNYTGLWELGHNTSGETGIINYTVYANDTLNLHAEPKTGNYTICICGTWSSWLNISCGESPCSATQMKQNRTRTCTPEGCNIEIQTQCYENSCSWSSWYCYDWDTRCRDYTCTPHGCGNTQQCNDCGWFCIFGYCI
jgi:hypothetical protein